MRVEDTLLEVAKTSILNRFDNSFKIDKADLLARHKILGSNGACFVTINLNGRLRGCIGSLVAHKNLLDDVIENAQKAAFADPRFKPLSYEELLRCFLPYKHQNNKIDKSIVLLEKRLYIDKTTALTLRDKYDLFMTYQMIRSQFLKSIHP